MDLEKILKDSEEIFNQHRLNLQEKYTLNLEGYSFKSIECLFDKYRQRIDSSTSRFKKFRNKLRLNTVLSAHKSTEAKIDMDDSIIYINPAFFQENNSNLEFATFDYFARLTYSIVHECCHTIVPLVAKKNQYLSTQNSAITNFRDILVEIRNMMSTSKRLNIEEGVADFCAVNYLRDYCENYSSKIQERLKSGNITDEEKRELGGQFLFLGYLEAFENTKDNTCKERKDGRLKPYLNAQKLYQRNGYQGLVEGITNLNLLLV